MWTTNGKTSAFLKLNYIGKKYETGTSERLQFLTEFSEVCGTDDSSTITYPSCLKSCKPSSSAGYGILSPRRTHLLGPEYQRLTVITKRYSVQTTFRPPWRQDIHIVLQRWVKCFFLLFQLRMYNYMLQMNIKLQTTHRTSFFYETQDGCRRYWM